MANEKVYEGTVGLGILIDIGEDISGATNLNLHVKKGDGTIEDWTPTIDGTQKLLYVTQSGDLVPGILEIQPEFQLGAWVGPACIVYLTIYEVLGEHDYVGHYIGTADITTWPENTTDDEKQEIVERAEAVLEAALRAPFYPKPFTARLNGNGKNRLFIPLKGNLTAISSVRIFGEELESGIYSFDNSSIYLDLSSSGAAIVGPELTLLLDGNAPLFPRGLNNIEVSGTYGTVSVPAWVKKAARMLVDSVNVPGTFTASLLSSETIGGYSYSAKDGGVSLGTGVAEVDELIRPFIRGKAVLMAP